MNSNIITTNCIFESDPPLGISVEDIFTPCVTYLYCGIPGRHQTLYLLPGCMAPKKEIMSHKLELCVTTTTPKLANMPVSDLPVRPGAGVNIAL